MRILFDLTCTPELLLTMIIIHSGEKLETPVIVDPRCMLVLLGVVMVIALLPKFGECILINYITVSMIVMLGTQFCSISQMDLRDVSKVSISVWDVSEACSKQKCGKAIGLDGIAMEAFMYGGFRLRVHLSMLFNMFVRCGYVLNFFVKSVIVPLKLAVYLM